MRVRGRQLLSSQDEPRFYDFYDSKLLWISSPCLLKLLLRLCTHLHCNLMNPPRQAARPEYASRK